MAWNRTKAIKQTTWIFGYLLVALAGAVYLFEGPWDIVCVLGAIWFIIVTSMITWEKITFKTQLIQLLVTIFLLSLLAAFSDKGWGMTYFLGVILVGIILIPAKYFPKEGEQD